MSIGFIAFLTGVLVVLIGMFIYSIRQVGTIELSSKRSYGGSVRRVSSSKFGKFYDQYLDAYAGTRLIRVAELLGLNLEEIEASIHLAGMEDVTSAIEIAAFRLLGVASIPVLGIPAYLSGELVYIILVFIVAVSLILLPQSKVRSGIEARRERILSELPSFIEQVYHCCESGSPLKNALSVTASGFGGELGYIFESVLRVDGVSMSWDQELLVQCHKLGIDELEEFCTDLVSAFTTGASVTDTLRKEVDHIKKVHRSLVRERISKMESSMVLPMVVFFVIPAFIIIMVPVAIQMLEAFE